MPNNDTIAVTTSFLIFIVLPALALLARRFWLRANRTARVEVLATEGDFICATIGGRVIDGTRAVQMSLDSENQIQ